MNEDLHRHLDGELPEAELGEAGRREAESWKRLLASYRVEMGPTAAPPWLEERIMAEVRALPDAGPIRKGLDWVFRPRPIRVSPLAVGLGVAALAMVFLFRGLLPGPTLGPRGPGDGVEATSVDQGDGTVVVYVQFALEAPAASSVAVAGDFDGWAGEHRMEDLDGDGIWTGRVLVSPGVHAYMFLVDGSMWMTDPRADRYREDGFGNRNAVLAVASPGA